MLNDNRQKGLLFVVSAPAGTGKSTLVKMLTTEFPNVKQSISFTTRDPRPGEQNGVDYDFVNNQEFEEKIKHGEFIEYIQLYGTYYGTSATWVSNQQNQGKDVVLVIDTQGGLNIKKTVPAVFVFIQPPSIEELKRRLVLRKTEDEEVIEKRLSCASREIEQGKQYDYEIINDNLEEAYLALKSIYIAEKHRIG